MSRPPGAPRLRPLEGKDDVRLLRCITCGAPSGEGLCDPCREPRARRVQPSEDSVRYDNSELHGWWNRSRTRLPSRCTCADCTKRRTKEYEPPPARNQYLGGKKGGGDHRSKRRNWASL